ncbi:MAG: hypothetical protein FWE23_11470 [Chitinivibrionia bacterium]|nr:hypothetical protein [Chitinivibrionia bacterium]
MILTVEMYEKMNLDEREKEFANFLKNNGVPNEYQNYIDRAIKNTHGKTGVVYEFSNFVGNENFFNCTSFETFALKKNEIISKEGFKDINDRISHGVPNTALNHYEKFLKQISESKIEETENNVSKQNENNNRGKNPMNCLLKFYEGKQGKALINKRERNYKARKKCLEHHGYKCKICKFDFEEIYGEIGKGIIHVHHITKIAEMPEEYEINPVDGLIPVCPNCHAVIHSIKHAHTPLQIKNALDKAKQQKGD